MGPETKAASERASERTNRGSHGRKGCVIRVPDEGTSGERSNEPTNKRTVTCAEGCRLGDSAYRTAFRCDTFSTNYVGRVGKKEIRQRTRRRRRRRSIPETPPMRIFSSAARASLRDSHAIDLFPYRRLIPVSACGAFLPSFLLLSLSASSCACHSTNCGT